MRSIWSGAISFGLINIPIKLYSASEERALSFDLLHKKDLSPIRYARICKQDGSEVPYEDIVKGYEYQKGEYVIIEGEEFKRMDREKTNTIEIVQFAKSDEIDSIYFDKPYFLEPGKGAEKAYALLRETLRRSNKVGVVKYVLRNKEHIGIIKPYLNAIILDQMRYAAEIRDLNDLKLPDEKKISKEEIDVALKLVNQLTGKFDARKFHDEYSEELRELIDAKVKGVEKAPRKKGAAKKPTKVHDIMSLLRASLENEKKPKSKPHKRSKVAK